MRLDGRRESSNVEDRRGKGGAVKAGGIGLGGLLIVGLIWLLTGRAPDASTLQQMTQGGATTEYTDGQDYSDVDKELMQFSKQILAGTEDVWTKVFRQYGRNYQPPKMVVFSGAVSTGCGNATADTGPFYCSVDQTIYLDLDFFKSMKRQIGADGDFAYAYVIAHEVGHHVQNQLGTLDAAHQQMAQYGKNNPKYNETSVRIELQADFYAGVWAYYDNRMFNSLEEGDLQEAIDAAQKIGDDYLQRQAGYRQVQSDLFTHGTSQQRMRWLKKGLQTGDLSQGDTFSPSYKSL